MKKQQRFSGRTNKPNNDILSAMGLLHKTRLDGSYVHSPHGDHILRKGYHSVQPLVGKQKTVKIKKV